MKPIIIRDKKSFAFAPALRDSRGRVVRGPFVTFKRRRAEAYATLAAERNRHDEIRSVRWPTHAEAFPQGFTAPPRVVTIPERALRDILYLLGQAKSQIAADHVGKELPEVCRLLDRGSLLLADCLPTKASTAVAST